MLRAHSVFLAVLVTALHFATATVVDAGSSRRSLELRPSTTPFDTQPSAPGANLSPNIKQRLSHATRPCFVFVHDVPKSSVEPYDQRHYFVALTTMLDDLLQKWRFDKIGRCESVLFTMLTTDRTGYGELAEIDLWDLQSVDNRSFDASDANLARTTDIVFLKDLYRNIRFVGREPGSPIYAALNEFLDTGYYGVVNSTEPMFEAAWREELRLRNR